MNLPFVLDPKVQATMGTPASAPAAQTGDLSSYENVVGIADPRQVYAYVQQNGGSLPSNTVFRMPDGQGYVYSNGQVQQVYPSRGKGLVYATPLVAGGGRPYTAPGNTPNLSADNPVNRPQTAPQIIYGQQPPSQAQDRVSDAQARYFSATAAAQELAMKQAMMKMAAETPYLANMLELLPYTAALNPNDTFLPERLGLNAQRETNLQHILDGYGPGQRDYLLAGNPDQMKDRMRALEDQQRVAYRNAMFGEGDKRGKAGAYWKGQGMFERPTTPMTPANGRVSFYNNQTPGFTLYKPGATK